MTEQRPRGERRGPRHLLLILPAIMILMKFAAHQRRRSGAPHQLPRLEARLETWHERAHAADRSGSAA